MSVVSAMDLNNDDVEEWYARHGEQYSSSVQAMIRGVGGDDTAEAIEFLGQVYSADHLLVIERVGKPWYRVVSDQGMEVVVNADLYRVDSRQTVWTATVTADVGRWDHLPDQCQREDSGWDISCWFWSGSVRPNDGELWEALAKELAASFPQGPTSKR